VIRSAFGKVALLALTTAMAGAATVGCSSDMDSNKSGETAVDGERSGEVGLTLQPVSGVIINTVAYSVTQGMGGAVVKSGSLPVPGSGADFSFGVPLPVGTGYFLTLSGATADGKVTCAGGFGPFNITANTTVDITPTLTCTDITTGQPIVIVDVETTACPDISFDYVVATPKTADVGDSISVLSNAVSASGAALTYQWSLSTPAVGSFTPPNAKDSSLECDADGAGVTVTVTASNGECSKSISTKISCANVLCGNGVVDTAANETCDTALDPTCPADCSQVCGDGSVEGTENCEPPGTDACTDTCTTRPVVCGDGFINGSEPCDTAKVPTGAPAGRTCENVGGVCQLNVVVAEPECGDGVVQAGETCDNAGGNNYAIANCGDIWGGPTDGAANDCSPITSAACATCETGSECAELMDPSIVTGSAVEGPATGTPRVELYYKTLDCVRDTACAVGNVLDCYCGTVSSAQCDAGNGNGVCKAVIEQGLETTNPTEISNRLSNVTLGGGLALARVACDKNNCVSACGL
jgi:hypothetical protein